MTFVNPRSTGGRLPNLLSGAGIVMNEIRSGQGAEIYRRSLKLLFEGWIPHDDGASEGYLILAANISLLACST